MSDLEFGEKNVCPMSHAGKPCYDWAKRFGTMGQMGTSNFSDVHVLIYTTTIIIIFIITIIICPTVL